MARLNEVLEKLRQILPADTLSFRDPSRTGTSCCARVGLDRVREVASLFAQGGFFLESLTGLDFQDSKELVYHFNTYEPGARVAVRVLCPHGEAAPTLSDLFRSASWQEREVWEFFGIPFAGHPDLRPLLLPEDADFHPLTKTFGVVNAYRKREEIYG